MENRFLKFISIFLIIFSFFCFEKIKAGDIILPDISIIDSPDPFNPLYEELSILMRIEDLFNSRCDSLTLTILSILDLEKKIIQWEWKNVNRQDIIEVKWQGKDENGNLVLPGNYLYNISCFFLDEWGQKKYFAHFGVITLILREKNFWRKIILDEIKSPLEEHKLFDIFGGFFTLIDDPQLLQYFFTEQTIPQSGNFLFGKIEGGSGVWDYYGGFGIKIKKDNVFYLLFFYSDYSNETFHLFVSYDQGLTWQEENNNNDFGAFKLIIPGAYLFWIKTDKIGSFPWEVEFLSAHFNIENQEENEIFDQTEKIEIEKEKQSPSPVINFSPKNPVKDIEVQFDASLSFDPEGQIKEFLWKINKGEEILANLSGTTTSFIFPENGEYQITLIATDKNNNLFSTSTMIKVEPFTFAIIADLHIGRGYPDYDGEGFDDGYHGEDYYLTERLKNVVNWIIENKDNIDCNGIKCPIKFLVILGDISDSAEKSEFLKAKEILDKLNDYDIPYVPLFGNHDVWPYTENNEAIYTLGENYFDEVFWSDDSKNTKLMKEILNWQRDNGNPKYKNFAFNYGGINFIGLDFNSRERFMKFAKGVGSDAVLNEINKEWLKKKLEEFKGEPIILLSHHPMIKEKIPINAFSIVEYYEIEKIIKNQSVVLNFGGHIHSFYDPINRSGLLPQYENVNKNYDPINGTQVLTTEALMVGSNGRGTKEIKENDKIINGVKDGKKGIIRIVKVFDKDNIDPYNWETTEKGDEFLAFNPRINFGFSLKKIAGLPCVELEAKSFTEKPFDILWNFGDGTESNKTEITKCYNTTGTFNVILTLKDRNSNFFESISRKIEIKEGIIPWTIKRAEEQIGKGIEFISQNAGMSFDKIGQIVKDRVKIFKKNSPAVPIGEITVHFEDLNEDLDLSPLITDIDIEKGKSILYMENWPNEIARSKILFIPK